MQLYKINTPVFCIQNKKIIKFISDSLRHDGVNQAYERSLYYILNAIRRGGIIIRDQKDIFVFAKSYDKPGSYSLIYVSNPASLDNAKINELLSIIPKQDTFWHHLFKRKAEDIKENFLGAQIITPALSKQIGSYIDEDTYPQVILPIYTFPKFKNSAFLKKKYLYRLLNDSKGSFKTDIFEYLNITQNRLNEPEQYTILIEENMAIQNQELIENIIQTIIKNWERKNKRISANDKEYFIEPILELSRSLINPEIKKISNNRIIFRAIYDIKLKQGGFWLGEYIANKSLLIPHVILTDHYYDEQYKFLLYDLIYYSYLKNFDYVNLGGSEKEELYRIKSFPQTLFQFGVKERKLYTVFIPKSKNY